MIFELGNLGFGFSARHAAAVLGGVSRSFAVAGQVLPVVPCTVLQGLLVHQSLTVLVLRTIQPRCLGIFIFATNVHDTQSHPSMNVQKPEPR